MDCLLSNGVFRLRLRAAAPSMPLAQRLRAFLSPYLEPEASAAPPDLGIALHPAADFPLDWQARCTEPMTIRDTPARGFTLRVRLGTLDADTRLAWDSALQVGYRWAVERRELAFYGDASNAFIHLIELVRYYGLLVEQARGTAILHSAAVRDPRSGGVVAIAGLKGAGKTTTLLDLVQHQGYRYFSGDKLLLDVVHGRLRARGWPDVPHIGLGTLRQHPELAERLGGDALAAFDRSQADERKVLLSPEAFAAAVGRSPVGRGWLERIVLPEVAAEGPVCIRRLAGAEVAALLAEPAIFEWPHTFITATWHGMAPGGPPLQRCVPLEVARALVGLPWTHSAGRSAPVARVL